MTATFPPAALLGASLVLLATSGLFAAPYTFDVHKAEELRARDGLPNVLARAEAGGTVRVAYVGGSITAANGWRPKTLAWLKQEYPKATFVEINAAISGTGSDFGACRLQEDVLSHNPDLVFLEFRVNGGGGFEAKSMEGIVRQIWRRNPATDICFVYTICEWLLPKLKAGTNDAWDSFGAIMEGIANRYGIPSIDLGVEVAKREAAGELIFKADKPVEGKLVFSQDGTHPGDAGHDIYRDVIARSILAMKATGKPGPHEVGDSLDAGNWEVATLLPIADVNPGDDWKPVDIAQDPVTTVDAGRTHDMLRAARRCDLVGASVTVHFNGTAVALSDIPSVEPIAIEATIDGTKTVEAKRMTNDGVRRYARFWWVPEMPAGDHTVKFALKSLPANTSLYLGQFLIAGTPMR